MKVSKFVSVIGGAAIALIVAPFSHAASVKFTESFEDPNRSSGWGIYQSVGENGEWTTTEGPGIEIQTSGVVVNAFDGNQYVELDSRSNSSMTRNIDLLTGTYEVTWYYQPRTSTANDNLITLTVSPETQPVNLNVSNDSRNGVRQQDTDWELVTSEFTVVQAATYSLTFSAIGPDSLSNSYGGFIDLVTLTDTTQGRGTSPVPLPAAAWLFLSVLGAGGLLRRAKGRR